MPRSYSTPIELRFADLDAYGHVNSAVYFTYLETARVKLFGDFFKESVKQGVFTVVARAECDYKIPIMLYDEVIVTLRVAKTGRSSFDLDYRLHDGKEKCYATPYLTLPPLFSSFCVVKRTKKSIISAIHSLYFNCSAILFK